MKRTDPAIRNSCWKKYLSSDLSIILFTQEKIFTLATLKPPDWPSVGVCCNQEERHRNDKINVQSLMASVDELQVLDSTPVWYLSNTESRLMIPAIGTWCCYNRLVSAHHPSDLKRILHLSAALVDYTEYATCFEKKSIFNTFNFQCRQVSTRDAQKTLLSVTSPGVDRFKKNYFKAD